VRAIGDCIVHQDRELVIVDKPIGIVSGGPDRQFDGEAGPRQSVESLLVKHLRRPVWTVHQLDRNTTGLNCFVLKASLVQPWNDRLKVPGTKRYLAIVHGAPKVFDPSVEIIVDLSLGERVASSGKTFPAVMPMIDPTARPARSRVRFLTVSHTNEGGFSLVEVVTETGRTHQVRLHLAAIDHPLVGEHLHRDPPCVLHPRHALHAVRLEFQATDARPALSLAAPFPPDLADLARRLGLEVQPGLPTPTTSC